MSVDQEKLKWWVDSNKDAYGKACVDVAIAAMDLLDSGFELKENKDARILIRKADDKAKTGGITGFMAGAAATIVAQCHSRGDEFRRLWNLETQLRDEGEKANEGGGVLNPALLSVVDLKE